MAQFPQGCQTVRQSKYNQVKKEIGENETTLTAVMFPVAVPWGCETHRMGGCGGSKGTGRDGAGGRWPTSRRGAGGRTERRRGAGHMSPTAYNIAEGARDGRAGKGEDSIGTADGSAIPPSPLLVDGGAEGREGGERSDAPRARLNADCPTPRPARKLTRTIRLIHRPIGSKGPPSHCVQPAIPGRPGIAEMWLWSRFGSRERDPLSPE